MLILFHHTNLVLVQHTESTLSIVYLLLQQLISLRSKHLCKKICLCFWSNYRSKMKIYFDHRLMRDGKYDFKQWFLLQIFQFYIFDVNIQFKIKRVILSTNFLYNWLNKCHRNIWDFLYKIILLKQMNFGILDLSSFCGFYSFLCIQIYDFHGENLLVFCVKSSRVVGDEILTFVIFGSPGSHAHFLLNDFCTPIIRILNLIYTTSRSNTRHGYGASF